MARSHSIFVLLHRGTEDPYAAFTVQYEMAQFLVREGLTEQDVEVWWCRDGKGGTMKRLPWPEKEVQHARRYLEHHKLIPVKS